MGLYNKLYSPAVVKLSNLFRLLSAMVIYLVIILIFCGALCTIYRRLYIIIIANEEAVKFVVLGKLRYEIC